MVLAWRWKWNTFQRSQKQDHISEINYTPMSVNRGEKHGLGSVRMSWKSKNATRAKGNSTIQIISLLSSKKTLVRVVIYSHSFYDNIHDNHKNLKIVASWLQHTFRACTLLQVIRIINCSLSSSPISFSAHLPCIHSQHLLFGHIQTPDRTSAMCRGGFVEVNMKWSIGSNKWLFMLPSSC